MKIILIYTIKLSLWAIVPLFIVSCSTSQPNPNDECKIDRSTSRNTTAEKSIKKERNNPKDQESIYNRKKLKREKFYYYSPSSLIGPGTTDEPGPK